MYQSFLSWNHMYTEGGKNINIKQNRAQWFSIFRPIFFLASQLKFTKADVGSLNPQPPPIPSHPHWVVRPPSPLALRH